MEMVGLTSAAPHEKRHPHVGKAGITVQWQGFDWLEND
jgi:hypothetical protein